MIWAAISYEDRNDCLFRKSSITIRLEIASGKCPAVIWNSKIHLYYIFMQDNRSISTSNKAKFPI